MRAKRVQPLPVSTNKLHRAYSFRIWVLFGTGFRHVRILFNKGNACLTFSMVLWRKCKYLYYSCRLVLIISFLTPYIINTIWNLRRLFMSSKTTINLYEYIFVINLVRPNINRKKFCLRYSHFDYVELMIYYMKKLHRQYYAVYILHGCL